jgi:alkylation response protein AidB-like acyl-CoA dehydrogenase
MSSDCPVFALSEEQDALREAVRAVADDKIAPRAAEVDRTSEFPWDVYVPERPSHCCGRRAAGPATPQA